jgi:hypothetical protein
MSGGDGVAILVTVLMFVVSTLLALIAWVFLDFRRTVTRQIKTNGRHLDSIISTLWTLMLRLDSVETFLDDTTEYRPVKVPIPPSHDDKNGG